MKHRKVGIELESVSTGNHTPEEVRTARNNNQLHTLDLEVTNACNGRCHYCYRYHTEGPQSLEPDELTLEKVEQILTDAKTHHGLERLYLLGGEPLLQNVRQKYLGILRRCNELGIRHTTLTNGLCVTPDLAKQLRECEADVCIKLNGLTGDVHDSLVDARGAFNKVMAGFDFLAAEGYGAKYGRPLLGFETVVTRSNYHQIPDMWVWARGKGIIPFVEKLTIQGRSIQHRQELEVSNVELKQLFEYLNRIDREQYGFDWDITPPIAGCHCSRFYTGLTIQADGIATPCVGVDIRLGDLKCQTIAEILTSPLAMTMRHMDEHIKGKCRLCKLKDRCYGCRGAAYQAGDVFGEDPNCWLKGGE